MACQRILHFGRAVKVQKRERRVHVRFLDRGKHAVRTFQYGHRFLSELQGDTYRRLQHSHQLAGGQAVSGNVSNVGEQRSVALHGIDQVAAHFCAGNGFPVDLEAVNPKRKRRNQSRLYAVCEGKFGLHADGRDAFGPDEIDEQPIPDDRAHEDADGVEDDSTVQRLHVRRRGRMKRDTNRQPQAGQRNQQKNKDETKAASCGPQEWLSQACQSRLARKSLEPTVDS